MHNTDGSINENKVSIIASTIVSADGSKLKERQELQGTTEAETHLITAIFLFLLETRPEEDWHIGSVFQLLAAARDTRNESSAYNKLTWIFMGAETKYPGVKCRASYDKFLTSIIDDGDYKRPVWINRDIMAVILFDTFDDICNLLRKDGMDELKKLPF